MIPQDFKTWKHCIEEKCRIRLTKAFAKQRLAVYNNGKLPETQRFVKLYGETHLNNIKEWFNRIVDNN